MRVPLHLFLLMMCFLLCSSAFSQKLTGTVTNAGKPLQGGSVRALPSGAGTATDSIGNYSLILKAGTYKITYSDIGFESKTITVELAEGENKILNVDLVLSLSSLNEVVVTGNRGGGRTKIESPVPVDVINVNTMNTST